MAFGRPPKYTPEIVQAAWDYVKTGWIECGDSVPSIAGLAIEIGITRETAYAWAKDENKDFSDILGYLMQKQDRVLSNNGLNGTFAPTITKLMLTKHGYSDKVEQDLKSSDKSMTPTVIERIIVTPDVSKG